MILIIIILIAILISLFIFKPDKSSKKITLSLNELSPIWTRYNEVYDDVEVSGDTDSIQRLIGDIKKPVTEKETVVNNAQGAASEKTERKDSLKNQSFLIEPLKSFWEKCIQPYQHVFESQNVSCAGSGLVSCIIAQT